MVTGVAEVRRRRLVALLTVVLVVVAGGQVYPVRPCLRQTACLDTDRRNHIEVCLNLVC